MTPPPLFWRPPLEKKKTPKKKPTYLGITQLSRAQYVMEVAHDLYNARRYHLPCLRAQNLTTNHRNGHRLAGCQVPRLVPTCWYQVGQKLAAGSTVNRGAIFDHHSKRLTILHSSSSFSTVFMYPLIQRKLQRNHANVYQQRWYV